MAGGGGGWDEKHEIFVAAFGSLLFYFFFYKAEGRHAPSPNWIHYWGCVPPTCADRTYFNSHQMSAPVVGRGLLVTPVWAGLEWLPPDVTSKGSLYSEVPCLGSGGPVQWRPWVMVSWDRPPEQNDRQTPARHYLSVVLKCEFPLPKLPLTGRSCMNWILRSRRIFHDPSDNLSIIYKTSKFDV